VRFRFNHARQEITRVGRFWLIDDTYNSNPISLESAICTLNALHIKGKRIAVCADMLELGLRSKVLHQLAGKMIARSVTDVLLTTGRQARHMAQSIHQVNSGTEVMHCHDLSEVHRNLKKICAPGDAVLVKGSRGMHMERTVKFLKSHFN